MIKILYRDNKFWLMVDVPEEFNLCNDYLSELCNVESTENCSCVQKRLIYDAALKACESSAIEISNPEVIPWYFKDMCEGLWYYTPEFNKPLKDNDSFPIPDNLCWEIKDTCKWRGNKDACGNEMCWDLEECQNSPLKQIAILRLKPIESDPQHPHHSAKTVATFKSVEEDSKEEQEKLWKLAFHMSGSQMDPIKYCAKHFTITRKQS